MAAVNNQGHNYPIASLYVGDLDSEVTEALLFEKFSAVGQVLSIRVCRDIITRHSLGYAYVNYQNPSDAERAIDTLNFEKFGNRPIRIMWSQRDPSLRRSGVGNIFIKNLDKSVDNKVLFDTCSVFGNILSCKVSYDDKGVSKGYGFVHFDSEESANSAIQNLNNKVILGRKVFVGKFVSRDDRDTKGGGQRFTNVYVKNLGDDIDTDQKLFDLFKEHGTITSGVIAKDENGKSKGFGFVCFSTAAQAEAAVQGLNGKDMGNGKSLYVGRAQKKAEREAELKRKLDLIKMERINRSQGVNLYVKNLEDSINDERLQQAFSAYGTITSAKVMCDEKGRSKGFGFVCFSTPEEATKAVTEMNNKIIVTKPLYVALAQRKEDREAQKLNMHFSRGPMAPMPTQAQLAGAQMAYPANAGQFAPAIPAMQGQGVGGQGQYLLPIAPGATLPRFYQSPMPGQMPGQMAPNIRPRHGWQPNLANRYPMNNANYRGPNPRMGQPQGGRPPMGQVGFQGSLVRPSFIAPQPGPRGQPHQQHRVNANLPRPQQPKPQQANNQEETQQAMGEQLFTMIYPLHPKLAGKITGMLLEMSQNEILDVISSVDLLKAKVDEALKVLSVHEEPKAE